MKGLSMLIVVLVATILPQVYTQIPTGTACQRKDVQYGFVCVCDHTFCDFPGVIDSPTAAGDYIRIISDESSKRFEVENGVAEASGTGETFVNINHNYEHQKMFGFGGAFTDSAGLNVAELNDEELTDLYINSYFAPEGIEYSVCRIPIAGSDFSTRPYSYDDVDGDVNLDNFALQNEDYNYKIPLIQKADKAHTQDLWLFGSPWAPPAWMKENGMANGSGGLLTQYWDNYSNYFVRFVEAYEAFGFKMWGLTVQNEPLTGFEDWAWNTCRFSETEMRDYVKDSLGPTLDAAGLERLVLMTLDHNRDALVWYPQAGYENTVANKYIDGTAVHWYADATAEPSLMDEMHSLYPDKFLLYTEACEGWYGIESTTKGVHLGEWARAENYAFNILEDVNHWSTGWVDWNMALSLTGGPNWAGNYVDSPIITDPANNAFYKQPTFYAMGHFSKFIQRDALRVGTGIQGAYYGDIEAACFHNPDGTTTYIVMNVSDTESRTVSIENADGTYINIVMTPNSLESIIIMSSTPQ